MEVVITGCLLQSSRTTTKFSRSLLGRKARPLRFDLRAGARSAVANVQSGFDRLRENNWITRLDTGYLAITALGVDRIFELGGPAHAHPHLIRRGNMHTPRTQRAITG